MNLFARSTSPQCAHLLRTLTSTWSHGLTGNGPILGHLPQEANISNSTGTRKFALSPRRGIRGRSETSMRRGKRRRSDRNTRYPIPRRTAPLMKRWRIQLRVRDSSGTQHVNSTLTPPPVSEHVHTSSRRTFNSNFMFIE